MRNGVAAQQLWRTSTTVQPARHTHGVVTGAVQMREGLEAWVPQLQTAVDGVDYEGQGTYRKRRHGG